MKQLLSIDGGGIRGIIPGMVIAHLEAVTGRPACDLFDLIAGTSTGGILALGLTTPDPRSPGRPRYSAAELVALYLDNGPRIFSRSLWRRFRSAGGVLDETYPHRPLEVVLADYFGEALLGEALIPTMVTAYEIETRSTMFMKSWQRSFTTVRCRDAARATSAAPTYFEPAHIEINGHPVTLIDGGVFVNSPSVSTYAEAIKRFDGASLSLLSLGSGELIRPIPFSEARNWGQVGWVVPLIDCMFDGVAKTADYQMRLLLGSNYARLQPRLEFASDDMDDATAGNLLNLRRTAEGLIEDNRAVLDAWAESLVSGATPPQ